MSRGEAALSAASPRWSTHPLFGAGGSSNTGTALDTCIGVPHFLATQYLRTKGIKPQFPNGIVSSVSFVSTTNAARSLAGFATETLEAVRRRGDLASIGEDSRFASAKGAGRIRGADDRTSGKASPATSGGDRRIGSAHHSSLRRTRTHPTEPRIPTARPREGGGPPIVGACLNRPDHG